MRVVIQRVKRASVTINGNIRSAVRKGLLILVGIENSDNEDDIDWLCNKIVQLRIFNDEKGIMNLSVIESGGDILIVSQFTLHALTKKGNRPSYIKSASSEIAIPVYQKFINKLSGLMGKEIHSGEFGADMEVELINDGPVTILIDSRNKE
jgi:D-aminoacyl-tRNA deacylase